MSTLIYSVRNDGAEHEARTRQDRRRVSRFIILMAVAIGPGVFLADRLAGTVAWRSFLGEALSLCLFAAVAVWYGLRLRAGTAWRVALTVYLVGLLVIGMVDFTTKRGLSGLLVDSPQAKEPGLLVGVLLLLFIPLLGGVARYYPSEMSRIGFSASGPISRLGLLSLVGLGVGLLIGFHFWLTAKTAGIDLTLKPWPYTVWQVSYELGPQSLTEELFMRGVVFNELYFGREWNFWTAALGASGLELLLFLAKQDYSAELFVLVGGAFYTVVSGVVSAGLFRWSRSVVPGYANNVIFGVVSLLR